MKQKLIAVAMLALSGAAWSATDLVSAWQAARGHDPAYRAQAALAQTGPYKEEQARALWRPTVALQAGAGITDMKNEVNGARFSAPAMGEMNDAKFVTQIRSGTEGRFGLVAAQALFNRERSAAAAQLAVQSQLAGQQFSQAEQALFLRVARAYFDVLIAEDAMANLQAHKRAVSESLDIAKEHFRLGKSASTDMHEVQASYDGVLADEAVAAADLQFKHALFSDLTGLNADGLLRMREGSRLDELLPGELASLMALAQSQNPAVRMGELGREIARLEIERQGAVGSPTVDLLGQLGLQRASGSVSGGSASSSNRSAWLGVQLNVPLYTGGMVAARQGEAMAMADKARADVELAREGVGQQVRSAYLALRSGLEQVRALEQGVVSATSKLDATRTGQELGARTTSDVLNAQQALFGAKTRLLTARYQVLQSALSLSVATGEVDVTQLERINSFLVH